MVCLLLSVLAIVLMFMSIDTIHLSPDLAKDAAITCGIIAIGLIVTGCCQILKQHD